jgi:iron complex outermembrane receptor protein
MKNIFATLYNKLASINVVKVKEDKTIEVFNIVESVPDNTYQHGFAFGIDISLPAKFSFLVNFSKDVSGGALFNSEKFAVTNADGVVLAEIPPRNRWNFSFGNRNLFKTGISFNINYRYQLPATNFTSIINKSAKATPNQPFVDEFNIIDAQISKKIIPIKSIIKVGGTNLGGRLYQTTIDNPFIGTTYYIALLFDELLN